MRRIVAATLAFLFLLIYTVNAFAVTCDGYDEGYEWDGASTVLLADGETNCNVTQGIIRFQISSDENAVYFALMLHDKDLNADNSETGFILYIDGSNYITVKTDGIEEHYDTDKYVFSGAMSVNEFNGAFAEVRVGIKEGIPQTIKGAVRFIDYQGIPSDYFRFEIGNPDYIEPTTAEVEPTTKAYQPEETEKKSTTRSTTKKATTTKRKTTTKKNKTTKKTTTKKTTSRKTTTKKTTVRKTTTVPKTKTASTSEKMQSENNQKSVTIYYVEKEVIISQVYVTQTLTEEYIPTEAIAVGQAAIESTSEFLQAQAQEISEGKKYKMIVVGVSALLFAGMFVWAVSGLKKSKTVNEKAEESNTENKDK